MTTDISGDFAYLHATLTRLDEANHAQLKDWLDHHWSGLVFPRASTYDELASYDTQPAVVDHSNCFIPPTADCVALVLDRTVYTVTDTTTGSFDLPPIARAVAITRLRAVADLLERSHQ